MFWKRSCLALLPLLVTAPLRVSAQLSNADLDPLARIRTSPR